MCHSVAPTSDPARVTKYPANPAFEGSGQCWDSRAVRETELFKGPEYFHILDGDVFTPSTDPEAWDSDGVLTAHVVEIGNTWYMCDAGKKGQEWQTGLARAPRPWRTPAQTGDRPTWHHG